MSAVELALEVVRVGERAGAVYVGRRWHWQNLDLQASPLQNQFHISKSVDRDAAIEKYRQWLWKELHYRDSAARLEMNRILSEARSGRLVSLACWCAPKRCHGNVIVAAVEWLHTNPEIKLVPRSG